MKINFKHFSFSSILNLPVKFGEWLGRLWLTCSSHLKDLIFRVNKVSQENFATSTTEEKDLNTFHSKTLTLLSTTSPTEKESQKKKIEIEIDLNLKDLFYENEEQPFPEETENSSSIVKELLKDSVESSIKIEQDKSIITSNPSEIVSISHVESKTTDPISSTDQVLEKNQIPQTKKEEISTQHQYQRQRRRKNQNETISCDPQVSSSFFFTLFAKKKESYIIIDAGGGGNCLLLAFLKGLKMQYPELSHYEINGQQINYTAQNLRQLGVNFARKQANICLKSLEIQYPELKKSDANGESINYTIQDLRQLRIDFTKERMDIYGPYTETLLGYLDSDRKEFNQSILRSAKRTLDQELAHLNELLRNKKMTKEKYEEQTKAAHHKYTQFEKTHCIYSDEDFLNRLEKAGFYCSSVHLFILSIQFNVPIHVHTNGLPIQIFNPTKSDKSPIHLQYAFEHYKLKFYSQ